MAGPAREFSGEEHFQAPPATVFATLTDLRAMADTMPDVESAELVDPHTLKCVVRPGFSFLRGTLRSAISLTDLVEPASATMRITAEGIGVSMRVESKIAIEPEGAGSLVRWHAQVSEMKGLVATVSPALVQAAADKTIRDTWQQVRKRIDGA